MDTVKGDLGVTPLTVGLSTLRKLLSPYTGIARLEFEMLTLPGDPKMWHVACLSTNSSLTIGAGAPEVTGGINPSRDRAIAAALGEAAERYSVSYVPVSELRFARARDFMEPCVQPAKLRAFADEQYEQYEQSGAYSRFDDETPVQWVRGKNLLNGEETWIPSAYCYLPDHRVDGEPRITYSTTSGVSCALTYEEALLSALYELVERDAFMLMWYSKLALPLIDCSGSEELEADHRLYYEDTRLDYHAVDLSQFLDVPTATATVRDRAGFIKLAVGAASGRTIVDAIRKATREAFQTYRWAQKIRVSTPDWSRPREFSEIRTFEDHVLLHAFGNHHAEAAFIDGSAARRHVSAIRSLSGPSVREQIAALVSRFRARGMDAFSIDVTAPDLREIGLQVIRAFVPELAHLDAVHDFRFLGPQRLYSGAYEAGLLSRPLRFDELNPLPHPFP